MSEHVTGRTVTAAQRRNDLWLAAGLLVGAVISAWLGQVAGLNGDETPPFAWALVYAPALTLPLALRRRYPEAVLVTVALAFFVGATARIPEVYVGNVALFIAMYTVGAWVADRRRATLVRLIVIAAMFVWLLVTIFQAATGEDDGGPSRAGLFSPFAAYMLLQFLVNVAFFGGAYFFGERAWAGARSRAVLEERTADLERERELTAAQAVALDRVRIARELHDVVAHHVSAMGVQAGAARRKRSRTRAGTAVRMPSPTCGCATTTPASSWRSPTPAVRWSRGARVSASSACGSGRPLRGGTIEAGPRPRGGFLVRVRVPSASGTGEGSRREGAVTAAVRA